MDQGTITAGEPDFAARYAKLRRTRPEIDPNSAHGVSERVLGRRDELLRNISRAFRAGIPAYREATDEDLLDQVNEIVETVVRRVGNLSPPGREGLDTLEALIRRRVLEGYPLEALIRSVQVGTRELMAIVGEELAQARYDIDVVLLLHEFAWDWVNHATETIIRVHRELDLERTRHDRARRAEFLRALLHGQLSPEQVQSEGPIHGLDPTLAYVAFRARPAGERQVLDVAAAIGRSGADGKRRPLTELIEGDLVGCAPQQPEVGDDHLIAVGQPVELARLRESFADATIALDAAEAFGLTGTVDLIGIGPRSLALAAERSAARLDAHHLGPLDELGGTAEIELTARTLLECDQHVEQTARVLHVHPNTIRYRMNRFRELTGLDLRETTDVVTAWWLLNRRVAGHGPAQDRRAGLDRRLTS